MGEMAVPPAPSYPLVADYVTVEIRADRDPAHAGGRLLLMDGVEASHVDLDDPTRVVGRLREPLLSPDENERAGYVPNVVYSCGAMLHDRLLVIPYSMSDFATSFATVPLAEILGAMR